MAKLIIGTPEEIADIILILGSAEIEDESDDWDEDEYNYEGNGCDCCECGCGGEPHKPICTSDPKRGELHFTGLDSLQWEYLRDAFKTVIGIMRF